MQQQPTPRYMVTTDPSPTAQSEAVGRHESYSSAERHALGLASIGVRATIIDTADGKIVLRYRGC
jgi:hypothetical protein